MLYNITNGYLIISSPLVTRQVLFKKDDNNYMNNSKLIPERLINARESLNISKADASRKIGLSKIGYNRYESGERTPSPQMMQVIASTLNTSVDYLVGITDNPGVDTVQLNRQQDAELFDLVLEYKNADDSMKKRILAYAKAFQK